MIEANGISKIPQNALMKYMLTLLNYYLTTLYCDQSIDCAGNNRGLSLLMVEMNDCSVKGNVCNESC
jgi:hypothetical protein